MFLLSSSLSLLINSDSLRCKFTRGVNVYKRYVDGIFVTFNSRWQLLKFIDYMIHQHSNIKFTFEVEKNSKFSFLDVKICRENNKFTTSVFRKPTFSGVFTNFDSFIPISYKHGLVKTLIFRCFKIVPLMKNFIMR